MPYTSPRKDALAAAAAVIAWHTGITHGRWSIDPGLAATAIDFHTLLRGFDDGGDRDGAGLRHLLDSLNDHLLAHGFDLEISALDVMTYGALHGDEDQRAIEDIPEARRSEYGAWHLLLTLFRYCESGGPDFGAAVDHVIRGGSYCMGPTP